MNSETSYEDHIYIMALKIVTWRPELFHDLQNCLMTTRNILWWPETFNDIQKPIMMTKNGGKNHLVRPESVS